MNIIINQLLNPVAHYPQGGRIIKRWEDSNDTTPKQLTTRWRSPEKAAKYKRIYDMHYLDGMTLAEIARVMKLSHSAPHYAIRQHEKALMEQEHGQL